MTTKKPELTEWQKDRIKFIETIIERKESTIIARKAEIKRIEAMGIQE